MMHPLHITVDEETHEMLMRRAEQLDGNVSKAVRSFIVESADQCIRVRRAIRDDLSVINRKLGEFRKVDRIAGNGCIIEEIDKAVRSIEDKLARVTSS